MSGFLLTGAIARFINQEWIFGSVHVYEPSLPALLIAGALVGFGTQMGNGCTSGHGLCGLPRFSLRSLVAVCGFFGTAALTASVTRLALPQSLFDPYITPGAPTTGLPDPAASTFLYTAGSSSWFAFDSLALTWVSLGVAILLMAYAVIAQHLSMAEEGSVAEVLASFGCAVLFGIGLCLSGMTDPHRVSSFLDWNPPHGWNPQLLFVLGCGVGINLLTFYYIQQQACPLLNEKFTIPTKKTVTWRLVAGAVLFGVGWGMVGICPGPGIVALGSGRVHFGIWLGAVALGIWAHFLFDKWTPEAPEVASIPVAEPPQN